VTLRIATYNIRKGGSRRRAAIADVLTALDADVTVLQEATDRGVIDWLAVATDSEVKIAEAGRSVAILARASAGACAGRWHRLPTGRSFAEVDLAERGIRLFGVHLSAGLSGRGERRRSLEVERLLAIAADPPGPARTLIIGDFNAVSPSDALKVATLPSWIRLLLRIDGGISTRVIGRVLTDGFVDAFRLLNPTESGATIPAAAPTVRLDYVMLGRSLVPEVASCRIGDASLPTLLAASDHLPLLTVLDV
jgi:endonuclease/exonuclease/phosphatase family metal-dependent hydrolase